MERLLKRHLVQVSLEEAEKEMGGHTLSLQEMEEMLKERGVDTTFDMGKRIASDNVTRYIYITGNNTMISISVCCNQTVILCLLIIYLMPIV